MAVEIAKEEFHEWLLHPVTRELMARFREDRERIKESWASGEYASDPHLDAKVRGQCEVISQLLSIEESDLSKED